MFRKRRRTTVTCNHVLKGNCSKWYKDTRPILHNSHVGDLQWFSINEFRIEEDDRLITQYERSCSSWLKLCLFFNYHLKWTNLSRISLIFIFTQKAKWSFCIHFLETIIMINPIRSPLNCCVYHYHYYPYPVRVTMYIHNINIVRAAISRSHNYAKTRQSCPSWSCMWVISVCLCVFLSKRTSLAMLLNLRWSYKYKIIITIIMWISFARQIDISLAKN